MVPSPSLPDVSAVLHHFSSLPINTPSIAVMPFIPRENWHTLLLPPITSAYAPLSPRLTYICVVSSFLSASPSASLPPSFICVTGHKRHMPELADQRPNILEERETRNKTIILTLYEALSKHDVEIVHRLLAPDLEWWFHGPPSHQYLVHLLTGGIASSSHNNKSAPFVFSPDSITTVGEFILAEGCNLNRSINWVHAWTVNSDGIITSVREYFNTSVTVTRLGGGGGGGGSGYSGISSCPSVGSEIQSVPSGCQPVWESRLSNRVGISVPGLVIAL